jgi:WD40 repeat protein
MRRLKGHQGDVECLAFHPGGRILATGDDGGFVRIWDVLTGERLFVKALEGMLGAVAFSPCGNYLAAGTYDGQVSFCIINPETGVLEEIEDWAYQGRITSIAFSPDGKWLAWLSYSTLMRVEVGRPHESRRLEPAGDGFCLRYTPDRGLLVRTGLGPRLLFNDPQTLKNRGRMTHGEESGCWSVAFTSDGKVMVLGLGTGVQVWNLPERRLLKRFNDHKSTVSSVALAKDGTRLITGGYDNRVNVYAFSSSGTVGERIGSYFWRLGRLFEVSFTPDGTLAAAGGARGVVLWDVE